ncbi:MAG: hypothetical protein AAGH88_11865 [Planctomycetota bacterium]
MDNRFGFKDLALVVLLVAIIVIASISLVGAKRQSSQISDIAEDFEQMQTEVARLRDKIEELGAELDAAKAESEEVTSTKPIITPSLSQQ